jgi:drug/metabolite transporter (DMT)-like permease
MRMTTLNPAIISALLAAGLFGASTPLAKLLVGDVPPLLLGGLLYFGSGIGLGLARLVRDRGWSNVSLSASEWRWLLLAILSGGIVGPVLLMVGLQTVLASTASLMLNLEGVLTALLAWIVFREHTDRRVVLGMVAIIAGGILLALPDQLTPQTDIIGPLAVAAACLCWAIDNNLTRKVATTDALFIASSKGLVAGIINCTLALALGQHLPNISVIFATMSLGLAGYGASLVLFVLALRGLGTARTGAYFSTAPFIGAALALMMGESAGPFFWWASALMCAGVWLHLTETHAHDHVHEPLAHEHTHSHDEHHQHEHDFEWDGVEPHTHFHRHTAITHTHPHFPDIHHRHTH